MEGLDKQAYTSIENNYLETLAKTFINPARQNQFIQENIFSRAPVRRNAIAKITNPALTGPHAENPFWCQQFDLRQSGELRGGQPSVQFDAADNCRPYVTTMKTKTFQDDIPSIPIDNFKNHYAILFVVFDLTSMKDATENLLLGRIFKIDNVSLQ